jgi:hypothetical protein
MTDLRLQPERIEKRRTKIFLVIIFESLIAGWLDYGDPKMAL